MYQLIPNSIFGAPINTVKRLLDNVFIPFDPTNSDYQKYLEWVAEGNTPEPADEPEGE
jgi:hypothetical protein